jgi:hypothetical protein
MSDQAPAPADHAPETGGEGAPPPAAARPAPPSPTPATTTDLGRFPEKSETGEITTFLAGDALSQAKRPGSDALRPTPLPVPSVSGLSDLPLGIDPQIEIERRLSAGGMGEVFLARQKHLGRYVAVKRIRDLGAEIATKERFILEAKAQSRLQHPGIAQVHDLREAQGELYLIMEYVEGRTLEEILAKDGKFSPDQVAALGGPLTEALEAAAHEGYIHRDLKPGNVMLTASGKIKIIDFGLALLIRNLKQTRLTEKGEILGTPAFMSPEQLNQEEKLDVRSDIWSLGVLLYTLATAETPFTGKDFICTVKNVMMTDPVPLTTLEPGFPPGLWQAIARALRKDRNERWQDYASFREALLSGKGRAGDGALPDPVVAERSSEYASSGGTRRLGRGVSALVFGALVALLGILAIRYLPLVQKGPAPDAGTGAAREDALPLPASPPTKVEPERAKAPPPSPELSPAPSSAEKLADKPLLPPPGPAPKSVALREKLVGYAATEEEVAFMREVLDVFSQHRPELQVKEFAPIEADLDALERELLGHMKDAPPAPEKEYRAAQIRSACRMVKLAKGALLTRLEELMRSKEAVTLLLGDGASKTGVVEGLEGGNVAFAVKGGGQEKFPLGSILPESLKAQGTPASAFLALLALSGTMEHSFPEVLDLSASRDDFLFWIPIAVRLARLEVEATAKVVAAEKMASVSSQAARPVDPRAARVGSLAEMLANAKDGILRLFGHIQPDFDIVEREGQALRLLLDGQHAKVLALGPATAAFPVAAEILLGRFQAELEAGHDELHARTGWHGYGWRLFPPEKSLKEQQKFWDLDPEGNGTLLQANEVERRVAMGKGAMRAPEGVLAKVVYEPKDGTEPAPHWRFLLRSGDGALSYLKFDRNFCALYRTRLEPGRADEEVAKASLPAVSNPVGERLLALLPIDGALHVLVDGRHVLTLPAADAAIPMQLSFSVAQGKLWIQSVMVKKSPEGEEGNR